MEDGIKIPDSIPPQEVRKSYVRVVVTYVMIGLYAGLALTLAVWFLWQKDSESALSIFTGISGAALGTIGYWFGERKKTDRT